MTSRQKTIKYVAMALAILLAVSIIGGVLSIFTSLDFFFGSGGVVGEKKTYRISSEITQLDIDINAAYFVIKTDSDFRVESNLKSLTVQEQNGKLIISEKKRFWNSYKDSVKLELYIPENTVFEKADIVTGAGVVSVSELSAKTLTLELGAGKVDIESLTAADRAEIDGGAGKITIDTGFLANLDLDMGVGELNLTGRLIGECDLDCGVGATNLVLLGTAEDYRIEIDKGLGDATVDGQRADDGNVFGLGENEIDIDGGIGRMKISFKDIA